MVTSETKRNWVFLSLLLMSSELSVWHYGTAGNNFIEKSSQISGIVCGHCSPNSYGKARSEFNQMSPLNRLTKQ